MKSISGPEIRLGISVYCEDVYYTHIESLNYDMATVFSIDVDRLTKSAIISFASKKVVKKYGVGLVSNKPIRVNIGIFDQTIELFVCDMINNISIKSNNSEEARIIYSDSYGNELSMNDFMGTRMILSSAISKSGDALAFHSGILNLSIDTAEKSNRILLNFDDNPLSTDKIQIEIQKWWMCDLDSV